MIAIPKVDPMGHPEKPHSIRIVPPQSCLFNKSWRPINKKKPAIEKNKPQNNSYKVFLMGISPRKAKLSFYGFSSTL
jgi:hypothetical protein